MRIHFVFGDNVFKNMYNKQGDFTSIIGHFFYIFINIYGPLAITTENDYNDYGSQQHLKTCNQDQTLNHNGNNSNLSLI